MGRRNGWGNTGEFHQGVHRASAGGRLVRLEAVVCDIMALRGQWLLPMTIGAPDPACRFPLVTKPSNAKLDWSVFEQFVRIRRARTQRSFLGGTWEPRFLFTASARFRRRGLDIVLAASSIGFRRAHPGFAFGTTWLETAIASPARAATDSQTTPPRARAIAAHKPDVDLRGGCRNGSLAKRWLFTGPRASTGRDFLRHRRMRPIYAAVLR